MSFFPGAQGTSITGHIVTMNAYSGPQASDRVTREGFNILRQNATPSALYGSSIAESRQNTGCLHGTRLEVQAHIVKWLNNPESEVAMWMYGPAGVGKTAIAQTVAKSCAKQGQLASSFFFFRSDDGRNSAKHLIPTLAFKMVQHMPHTRDIICTAAANDPLLFSAPLEDQIAAIIFPAISEPFPSSQIIRPPGPMLFIIDGLDECMDAEIQRLIVRSFVSLLATIPTVIRHKILIISRPESHIVAAFSAVDISSHVHHLCLDKWESIDDIEIFLRAELEAVRQTHPLKSYLDAGWPSNGSFKKLLHKSFESFAYATAAIRYISSHDRHPEMSLNSLLGLSLERACEAHSELDSLYRHILESFDQKTRYTALKILCLYTYLSVDDIETLASLLGENIFVVELVVIRMSSVVQLAQGTISYYHTSFNDFLVDQERSGSLYLYSSDVASAVLKALPRGWAHPTTRQDYRLLELIAKHLAENINAGDMHIYMLNTFLATELPPTIVVPPDCSYDSVIYTFNIFIREIDVAAHSQCYPEAVTLLFCEVLERMVTWLGSQGPNIRTLDNVLDATFMRESTPVTDRPHSWDVIVNIVGLSDNSWQKLCQLLPREEMSDICIGFVERYLSMPRNARFKDISDYVTHVYRFGYAASTLASLTGILIQALETVPISANVCRILEQTVLDAISASPRQMIARNSLPICACRKLDEIGRAEGYYRQKHIDSCHSLGYTHLHACNRLGDSMDQYILKTHSELDLPYISDDIERLYHGRVSKPDDAEAATAPRGTAGGETSVRLTISDFLRYGYI